MLDVLICEIHSTYYSGLGMLSFKILNASDRNFENTPNIPIMENENTKQIFNLCIQKMCSVG